MENYEQVLELLLKAAKAYETSTPDEGNFNDRIPVGVSNRHIHLSSKDLCCLFGESYELHKLKELSQPGQYACKETVTICGPKGAIEKVRILGPTRAKTQVEILTGDCFKLGVQAPTRLSGDLDGSSSITLVGPKGSLMIDSGLIVAQRHIHMTLEDAQRLNVKDNEVVCIQVDGIKGGVLEHVVVRATHDASLECHLDIEEANALGLLPSSSISIVK